MNSKLYYEFTKELNAAQEELDAIKKLIKDEGSTPERVIQKNLIECRQKQWQKAVNLLYTKGQ
ncbi:MAG TPA: hypothetical protein VK190_02430 [Pseudoneobacillus sp.]|nr:hypothetical protein [Pseudoneobacillus sp.]